MLALYVIALIVGMLFLFVVFFLLVALAVDFFVWLLRGGGPDF